MKPVAAAALELKQYQQATLDTLRDYLRLSREVRNVNAAFYEITREKYRPVPGLEELPYVCLRLPTGGGKTLVAAHSVGIACKEWLRADRCVVLWLVPSNAIRTQTLDALRNLEHPYRLAVDAAFAGNVEVLDISEALHVTKPVFDGSTCIIVATLAALRVGDPEGRKVYEDNGNLMSHLSGLADAQEKLLLGGDIAGRRCLANVLRLRRPVVVMDEAHNARTPLSFETLERFRPSCVIEFTATPETGANRKNVPSNVLAHVSAADLKQEGMIKLPIRLKCLGEAKRALHEALQWRSRLETAADALREATGEYIRPILLIQAQKKAAKQETLTPEAVRSLLEGREYKIDPDWIKVVYSGINEIEGVNLLAEGCPVRVIITVQALGEGWDCPFAYVLCSFAELFSDKSVEQILGRVLRMPKATPKSIPALNSAYAFATSDNFIATANSLRDGLVKSGFEKFEAERMVVQAPQQGMFDETVVVVFAPPALEQLPEDLQRKVRYDAERKTLVVSGVITERIEKAVANVLPAAADRAKFTDAVREERKVWSQARTPAERGEAFNVPWLAMRQGDFLARLDDVQLGDFEWSLADCDATLSEDEYGKPQSRDLEGEIDTTDTGKIRITSIGQLQRDLAPWRSSTNWNTTDLAAWLDRNVDHPDQSMRQSAPFFLRLVEGLIDRGLTVAELVADKYRLRQAAERKYKVLRQLAQHKHGQQVLFGGNSKWGLLEGDPFEFPPDDYPLRQAFRDFPIPKHYYPEIGDMNGEEADCAMLIAGLDEVEVWVRNVERQPHASFWLPTSSDKFYPDFVAKLKDGRLLVVEYKGARDLTNDDTKEKRKIGELFEKVSDGQVIFRLVSKADMKSVLLAAVSVSPS